MSGRQNTDLWKVAPAAVTPSAACTRPPHRGQPSSGPRSPANGGQVYNQGLPRPTPRKFLILQNCVFSFTFHPNLPMILQRYICDILQPCKWGSTFKFGSKGNSHLAWEQLELQICKSPPPSKLKSWFLGNQPSHIFDHNSPIHFFITLFDCEILYNASI